MNKYVKPTICLNEELTEGVYAASGACYINEQCKPSPGKETPDFDNGVYVYRYDVTAIHNPDDRHNCIEQHFTITFSQPVTFKEGNCTVEGNSANTTTLVLKYTYFNNFNVDQIGLGNLSVSCASADLQVTGCECTYNVQEQ